MRVKIKISFVSILAAVLFHLSAILILLYVSSLLDMYSIITIVILGISSIMLSISSSK